MEEIPSSSLEQNQPKSETKFSQDFIPLDEYVEPEAPYSIELESGNKTITFFGAHHLYDSNDSMFKQFYEAFAKANPEVVFIEGTHSLKKTEKKLQGKNMIYVYNM